MTKDELRELESAPKTPFQIFIDRLVCFSPVIAGALALAEYYMIPNLPGNESTDAYAYFIGTLMAAVFAVFLVSFINKKVFYTLRYKAPFYSFIFLMFLAYDWLTLKTGLLVLPYFPWVDQVLWAFISDRAYMAEWHRQLADTALHGLLHGRGARPRDGRRLRLQQAYQLLDRALHEAARRYSLDYVAAGRHGARLDALQGQRLHHRARRLVLRHYRDADGHQQHRQVVFRGGAHARR